MCAVGDERKVCNVCNVNKFWKVRDVWNAVVYVANGKYVMYVLYVLYVMYVGYVAYVMYVAQAVYGMYGTYGMYGML